MHRRSRSAISAFLAALLLFAAGAVLACRGTPTPPCGRSIFLAKYCPRTVVVPRTGSFTVPIGVLPFLTWTKTPPCAQPASATISLTITCSPAGGGAPVVLGPVNFPQAVPVAPGPQGAGVLSFPVAAGTFPAGSLPAVCKIVGTYTVTFGAGTASGALSATGDTEVCLVEPAGPGKFASVPRLDLQYLSLTPDPGFQTCRKGDQALVYFLVTNNDKKNSVSVDLSSEGLQTSRLADGLTPADAYANFNYAISAPEKGTDTFDAGFGDELDGGELLPEGDPEAVDPVRLDRALNLPPLGAAVIPIAIRSHGMCLDGSCNERFVKLSGEFSNGDPALACASTALLVGDVPPKWPLCEIEDQLRVSEETDSLWTAGIFQGPGGPIPHTMTHSVGNRPPGGPVGTQLTGAELPNNQNFPSAATDYLRTPTPPVGIDYEVFAFPEEGDFSQNFNSVNVRGLPNLPANSPLSLPLVQPNPLRQSFFDVFYDIGLTGVQVRVMEPPQMTPIFQGTLQQLLSQPPPNLRADPGTSRTLIKRGDPSIPVLTSVPFINRLFKSSKVNRGRDELQVFLKPAIVGTDSRPAGKVWTAAISGVGAKLVKATGPLSQPIQIKWTSKRTKPAPATNIAILSISVDSALNSPLRIPLVMRHAQKLPRARN